MFDDGVDREEGLEAILQHLMLGGKASEDLVEVDQRGLPPALLRSDSSDVVEGRASEAWRKARSVVAEGAEDVVALGGVVGCELPSNEGGRVLANVGGEVRSGSHGDEDEVGAGEEPFDADHRVGVVVLLVGRRVARVDESRSSVPED